MTTEETAAAAATQTDTGTVAPVTTAAPAADAATLTAATVPQDVETTTLLADMSTLMGKPVTAEQLGSVFAWAKANPTDTHLQELITIADEGGVSSHGAIILLINRHAAATIATPVGTRLSDRVIKQAMSRTAQVPVLQPAQNPSVFIEAETQAIINAAKANGKIPTASEIVAQLQLEQGTN